MTHALIALSLGAGVQSTALALMAAHGEVGPLPDCAIFADTGDEPAAVYEHLAWLKSVLPYPVHQIGGGKTLSGALMAGDDAARIPFHVGAGGMATRQCTRNFKIRPIRREIRQVLGVGPRGHIAAGAVQSWVGISTDEAFRMKPSGVAYIDNRHPLIELGLSRRDCEAWLRAHGYRVPTKSACVFCPYQRNAQWKDRRDTAPADFERAVVIDRWLREPAQVARFRGELFVHQSRVPLEIANLDPKIDAQQPDLFNHECEGMCGQ